MEYELTRDKGYGGYKKKRALVKLEKESRDQSSKENSMMSPSRSPLPEELINDEGHAAREKDHTRQKNKVLVTQHFRGIQRAYCKKCPRY